MTFIMHYKDAYYLTNPLTQTNEILTETIPQKGLRIKWNALGVNTCKL